MRVVRKSLSVASTEKGFSRNETFVHWYSKSDFLYVVLMFFLVCFTCTATCKLMGWSYSKFPPKTICRGNILGCLTNCEDFPTQTLSAQYHLLCVARMVSLETLPAGEIGFSLLFGCRGNPPGMWVAARNPCKPDTLERPDSETVIRHTPLSQ